MTDYSDPTPTPTSELPPVEGLPPRVRAIRSTIQAAAAFVLGLVTISATVAATGVDVPSEYVVWLTAVGAGLTALVSVVQNTWDAYKGKA